jgi:cell division protein FtsL
MMRSSTFIALILVCGLGFGLFKVKYEVQSLEDELGKINRQTATDQDAIHVLKAEWSYLTQPVRIGAMAGRHLALSPVTSAQMGSFDQLPLKSDRPLEAESGDVKIQAVLKAMQVASKPIQAHPTNVAALKPGGDR